MSDERENRHNSVDAVLKALGQARIPEGLKARVVEGAERRARAASDTEFRWGDVFAGSPAAGVWWLGAVSGAAVAMLLVSVVMITGHLVHGSAVATSHPAAPGVVSVGSTQPELRAVPCIGSGMLRASQVSSALKQREHPRIAISLRSIPASEPALTKQERDLVRVASIGDLRELATLNPEVRERLEAEEAAQFQSFFAPREKVASTDTATGPAISTQSEVPDASTSVADPATAEQPAADSNNGQN